MRFPASFGAAVAGSIAILATSSASAQVRDISQIATDLQGQGVSVSTLFSVAAFVMGLALAAGGLLKLAKASERQHDPSNKTSTGWVMIIAGAMLVALPTVIGSGVTTIFGNTNGVINLTAPSSMIRID